MKPQLNRLSTTPLIVLAAIMIGASMVGASPAAAAKAEVNVFAFCNLGQPPTTPGFPVNCTVSVLPTTSGGPAPTGSIKISAPKSRGSVSTTECNLSGSCFFSYTPKGKGSDRRVDSITAIYSGDDNYKSKRGKATVSVAAAPAAVITLSCPSSTPTGQLAFCFATWDLYGPDRPGVVKFSAPAYKGTLGWTECSTHFSQGCGVTYTPKGKGSPTRVDTIKATYPADLYNSAGETSAQIHVTAP
jgi:hypothetical protein